MAVPTSSTAPSAPRSSATSQRRSSSPPRAPAASSATTSRAWRATCEADLGVPVIPLHCEGFKSKHWSTGFDATQHGILRQIVRQAIPETQAGRPDQRHQSVGHRRVHADARRARPAGELRRRHGDRSKSWRRCRRRRRRSSFCYTLGTYLGRGAGAGLRRAADQGAAALWLRRHRRLAARARPRHRPRGAGRGLYRPRARAGEAAARGAARPS